MFSGLGNNVNKSPDDDLSVQEKIVNFLRRLFNIDPKFSNQVIQNLNPKMFEKNNQFAADLLLTICNNVGSEANWNAMDAEAKKNVIQSSASSLLLDNSPFQEQMLLNSINTMAAQTPSLGSDMFQGLDAAQTIGMDSGMAEMAPASLAG